MENKIKGQAGMIEYLLMTVFTMVIILVMVFFLFGFEAGRTADSESMDSKNRVLLAVNTLTQSDIINKEDLMFDDSKLAGFLDQAGCEELTKTMSQEACINIELIKIASEEPKDCAGNYGGECNRWTLCKDVCAKLKSGGRQRGLSLPVNVYRKLDNKVELAVVKVQAPIK